ncbi:hypothetical protein [Novosphingobium sp. P6W]|uniref:hypothetical protein n=1 Tax=Novosphingobium sp. P6W TaxID=1609758 RepID=UPI0005C71CF4|nr:hypothetical protein [Novosphingobium sp. P6W]
MLALIDPRKNATSEERSVLALEMIADQLLLIRDHFAMTTGQLERRVVDGPPAFTSNLYGVESWENEGGHVAAGPGKFDVPGMTKQSVDVYSVGPYSYTDFASALSELRRQRTH